MAKNKLVVPQNGTQRAPSPLDNLVSGGTYTPEQAQSANEQKIPEKKQKKEKTSINLDPDVYMQFKVYCVKNKRSVSGLLEKAMIDIMSKQQ